MTRATSRVLLPVAGLSLAMVAGTLLLTPAIAEKAEATKDNVQQKVIVRKVGGHGKPDAARLKTMIEAANDQVATMTGNLDEAQGLLKKATAALQDNDEATARALVREAQRLLHSGGPDFSWHGGPHGFAHMIAPEDFDIDFDFDWRVAPGAPHMFSFNSDSEAFSAQELKIEINGDTMVAEGKDKDGKDFRFEGPKDDVKAKLKARGIEMHAAPLAPDLHGLGDKIRREIELSIPGKQGKAFVFKHDDAFGPLSEADRDALRAELADIAEAAAKLLRDGKTEEGMEKLHEAFGKSIRLGIAVDGAPPMIMHRIEVAPEANSERQV